MFHNLYCIKFAYLLLDEASHMPRPKFKVWGSIICHHEKKWIMLPNLISVKQVHTFLVWEGNREWIFAGQYSLLPQSPIISGGMCKVSAHSFIFLCNQLTLFESMLCARHCAKHWGCINKDVEEIWSTQILGSCWGTEQRPDLSGWRETDLLLSFGKGVSLNLGDPAC